MAQLPALLRQPAAQFLVLGAVLFGLYAGTTADRVAVIEPLADDIVVSAGRIDSLARQFARVWRRPPTDDELRALIREHVREEVMVREALALGLDRDDSIVRRRMQQKLEFLVEDTLALAQPSDADLRAYLDEHPERFRVPDRVDLTLVYFDPARHEDPGGAAEAALVELRADAALDGSGVGDPTALPGSLAGAELDRLEARLGPELAAAAESAPVGRWRGPIRSPFGVHLLRVDRREPGRVPALAEVRAAVASEWSAARRRELREAAYRRLRAKYRVRVAGSPLEAEP